MLLVDALFVLFIAEVRGHLVCIFNFPCYGKSFMIKAIRHSRYARQAGCCCAFLDF